MSCLILAEHDNSLIGPATAHVVTAATRIGGDIHLLVAGSGCANLAGQAARIEGVTKVLLADSAQYADQSPEPVAELVAELVAAQMARYSHCLAAATTTGKNIMPRVAALLDVAQISDLVQIESEDTFVRPIYAGNALTTVRSSDAIKVLTVRMTAFAAAGESQAPAPIESIAILGTDAGAERKSKVISRQLTQSERPELGAAKVVVSGGRGLASAENFHQILEPLADRLGGAIGASRTAVDAGFVANDLQIGQTGKIVAPRLYIAVGLSGAIQHVAGMKDSQVIVAINKDQEAPIFQVADYGLVADLFDAVPALTEALGRTGSGVDSS
ncbi:MAG: FAD-binding protein [Candidatus Accumulibacter sp.]|jgi:electron transfer flavoprotein alpha subunit|nr:FAD-binding protein [Accumulibacter sp.]